jgi:DNA-binding transcriptional ArsR family regulator
MLIHTKKPKTGDADYQAAAACLRILGHPDRLRMIDILLRQRLTVGALAEELGTAPHVTSTHLRLMMRCGFLREKREGRQVYYAVAEKHLVDIMGCVHRRFSTKSQKGPP